MVVLMYFGGTHVVLNQIKLVIYGFKSGTCVVLQQKETKVVKLDVKVDEELKNQLVNYSIAHNISKSEAMRRFIKQGIDNKIPENKLREELKSIKQELSSEMKKQTERIVSLQVKNLIYTLINFHLFKSDIFIKAMKHDFSDLRSAEDVNNFVDVMVNKAKKSAVDDKVDGLHSKNKSQSKE